MLITIFVVLYIIQVLMCFLVLIIERDFFLNKKDFLQTLNPFYLLILAYRHFKEL